MRDIRSDLEERAIEFEVMGHVVPLDSSAPRLSQAEKMAASG